MKLFFFLNAFLTIAVSAETYSQNSFRVDMSNARIRDVFKAIESQTSYRFFYNDELSDINRLVSLNVNATKVEEVLNQLFLDTDVSYTLMENNLIVIAPKRSIVQKIKITGTVTDGTTGEPIIGANVIIEGTTMGSITDLNGIFSIEVPSATSVLLISFVGYNTEKIALNGESVLNVKLVPDVTSLEEIVVVGYGVQKKSVVTGAISSIKGEDLANSSIARAEQALQGKTSGVQIIQNSGAPGADINVRIRGYGSNKSSEPIYIVNGLRVSSLSTIDPNDIQNIEVLKDAASSAIYGAEGANGVVLVTTKSGGSGKGRLTYEYQYGIQSLAKKVEVLNAKDYKTYMTEAGTLPASAADNTYDTDWQDEIFTPSASQKHYLSFTGGTEKGSFMLSLSYLDQDGIVDGDKDKYKRYSFMFNSDHKLNNWIKVGHNLSFTRTELNSVSENSEYGSVITSALMLDPLTPAWYKSEDEIPATMLDNINNKGFKYLQNEDGHYYGVSPYVTSTANPFVVRDASNPSTVNNIFMGNVFADVTPMKGLTFTSRFGGKYYDSRYHLYSQEYYYDATTNNTSSSVKESNTSITFWQLENFLSYVKSFGDHNTNFLLGMSASENKTNYLEASGSPLTTDSDNYDDLDYLESGASDDVSSNRSKTSKLSYFGRINYDFKSKYMFQFSLRKDAAGEDVLPKENRWGTFPALSGGWVISNENFFPKIPLTFAKIRVSWGQNGSLSNLSKYIYQSSLETSGAYPTSGSSTASATAPGNLSNEDLKWETSEQLDFGIDLRAFNDRLTFSADYYIKKTKDLLTTGTPSLEAGNDASYVNAGDVENKGLELEINYRNSIGELNYKIGVNLATLHNEVTYMNPNSPYLTGSTVNLETATRFDKGHPIWYFYGYKTKGINPDNGNPIYYTASGDTASSVTSADKQYIGSGIPTLSYGMNIDLSYKGFDFKAFLQGASGHDVMLGMVRTDRENFNKLQVFFDDRWTSSNTNASMPKASTDATAWHSDLMVFDGDYLKIKQLQLGYTLPKNLLSKVKSTNARIYVSVENAFTFTKYPGMDPEVGSSSSSQGDNYINSIGIDRGMYPNARIFLMGASISF